MKSSKKSVWSVGVVAFVLGAVVLIGAPIASYASSSSNGGKTTSSKGSSSKGSSSKGSSSKGTTGSKGASGSAGDAAFISCLKSHGVTLPTGRPFGATGARGFPARTSGPKGSTGSRGNFPRPTGATGARGFGGAFNSPTFQKALTACAKYRPQGGFGFGGGGFGGRGGFNSPALQTYLNCLKLHGVTIPSGTTGSRGRPTGASGASGPGLFNPSNPKVKAAMTACKALLPKPSGASGSKG